MLYHRYKWIPSSLVLTQNYLTTELYKNVTKLPYVDKTTTILTSTESYKTTTTRENKYFAYTSSNISNKTFDSDVKSMDFNFNTVKTTAATIVKINKTIDKKKLFGTSSPIRNYTGVHKEPPKRTKGKNNAMNYRLNLFLLSFLIWLSL